MDDEYDKPAKTYEVGYGKPPKAHQFQKGQSGNSSGRPKHGPSLDMPRMFLEGLKRKVPVTENGRKKKMTILNSHLKHVAHGFAKNEPRATKQSNHYLSQIPPETVKSEERKKIEEELIQFVKDFGNMKRTVWKLEGKLAIMAPKYRDLYFEKYGVEPPEISDDEVLYDNRPNGPSSPDPLDQPIE